MADSECTPIAFLKFYFQFNQETKIMYTILIEAEELLVAIGRPNTIIFDCRHSLTEPDFGINSYNDNHLPNAIYASMDEHLSQRPNGHNGRHPFPEIQAFIEWLKNCGVNNSTQVVAYDDAGGVYASRLWCLLKWLGHEAVAVLNGGVQSWIESKGILEREVTQVPEKGNFQPHTKDILVDSQYILKNLKNNGVLVIDARANDRFRGENETIDPIAGHIPGAKNRFFKTNLDDDGKFKSANTLKRSFLELIDVGTDQQVVHQCGSGVTACHNMLAMEVAGIKNSKLYPGSWSEWIADTTRPISTG